MVLIVFVSSLNLIWFLYFVGEVGGFVIIKKVKNKVELIKGVFKVFVILFIFINDIIVKIVKYMFKNVNIWGNLFILFVIRYFVINMNIMSQMGSKDKFFY